MYQYWLAKYYDAAWYAWYQESYLPSLNAMQDSTAGQDAAPAADDSNEQSTTYDVTDSTQQQVIGEPAELPQGTQTQSEFESQASVAVSTMAEQGSMFPDADVLGSESSFSQQTTAVATAEVPDSDAQLNSAAADSAELTQAEASEQPLGASEEYSLTFSLGGDSQQPHGLPDQEGGESEAFAGLATEEPVEDAAQDAPELPNQATAADDAEPVLAQEDSFFEDQAAAQQPAQTPTKGNRFNTDFLNSASMNQQCDCWGIVASCSRVCD